MCTVIKFTLYIILLMCRKLEPKSESFVSPDLGADTLRCMTRVQGKEMTWPEGSEKRGFIFDFVYETKKICQGFL